MSHKDKFAVGVAATLGSLSLVAFAPSATAVDEGYARNGGVVTGDVDTGFARNGGVEAPAQNLPGSVTEDQGMSATDITIAALAGLTAAGAGVMAAATVRRRRDHHVAHPA